MTLFNPNLWRAVKQIGAICKEASNRAGSSRFGIIGVCVGLPWEMKEMGVYDRVFGNSDTRSGVPEPQEIAGGGGLLQRLVHVPPN